MKKVVDIIHIPMEMSAYIESLNYELEARKSLLTFAMGKGMGETEAFNKYHDEYREFFMKFEVAKQDMYDTYIAEKWDGKNVDWCLHYSTAEIEITEEV